jgi:isochorismate pyruvate lyase
MAEVRAGVDALDRTLVGLLAMRMRFMAAAARIKTDRAEVRDEARKRTVIANASAEAARLGLDPSFVADFWEQLVEASIAHEMVLFDEARLRSSRARR